MQMHILIPAIKYDHKISSTSLKSIASAIEQSLNSLDVPAWQNKNQVQYLVDKESSAR